MSIVEESPNKSAAKEFDETLLFHVYPRNPAQPGDRAFCGYVKPSGPGWTTVYRYGAHPDLCVVCDELSKWLV